LNPGSFGLIVITSLNNLKNMDEPGQDKSTSDFSRIINAFTLNKILMRSMKKCFPKCLSSYDISDALGKDEEDCMVNCIDFYFQNVHHKVLTSYFSGGPLSEKFKKEDKKD